MTRNRNGKKPPETIVTNADGVREKLFTTSLGVVVHVRAMPPLLPEIAQATIEQEWAEAGKALPKVPTYTTRNVAGDEETHEHDEASLTTDEEKAEWARYKATLKAFDGDVSALTFDEVVRNYIRFAVDPSWKVRFKRLRPPEDPVELMDFYARVAVIGNKDDVTSIMRISAELTGVNARLMQAAGDSFPDNVEEPDTTGEVEKQGG